MATSARGLWLLAVVPMAALALAGAGQELPPADAQKTAAEIMQNWRKSAGEVRWSAWIDEEQQATGGSQAAPTPSGPGQSTKFTARDAMLWQREEKSLIEEGYKNFHNAKALGGTIGISCDMCHPNASNTHPETYPKYQTQSKKVALLRDMINWCIENPLKGKPLADDDPRLKSVEAYILSARQGVPLSPGKH